MGLFSLAWPVERTDFSKNIIEAGEGPKPSRRIRFQPSGKAFPTGHQKAPNFHSCIKDADNARTFHCCHGAVGDDYQRPPSWLNYERDFVLNKHFN